MKRFPCHGRLHISCRAANKQDPLDLTLRIYLRHSIKHIHYYDVAMPAGASDFIRDHVEWLTPSEMISKVRETYPQVTPQQIHSTWTKMSEMYWKRADKQLESARILVEDSENEIDLFTPVGLPEGVEIFCFGMKKIAEPLTAKVVEIAIDATCMCFQQRLCCNLTLSPDNTNSKHLELYSIMGEHDNAGFPLSYCLLSTATSIEHGKRKKSLEAWAMCVRNKYGLNPIFKHTDKDLAEIGMLRNVWPTGKISLCLWHLRRAIRAQLANSKLSTTPYNVSRAHTEFNFIDVHFIPHSKSDTDDYEGGPADEPEPVASTSNITCANPSALLVQLPPSTQPPTAPVQRGIELKQANRPPIILLPPKAPTPASSTQMPLPDQPTIISSRRSFCIKEHREPILEMVNHHYCAHPLIPGYAKPTKEAIRHWAVKQIYDYCVIHDLREVWAYLWENWYRAGRWELWARSAYPEIPRLRTTMIMESHWRRIKEDFLHHFHTPRVDLLVWIIINKLAPCYYRRLEVLMTDTGRYRELSSWRKPFKKLWRDMETRLTAETDVIDSRYRPNVSRWTCTCPAFVLGRFLICKHLIQMVHRVPTTFFLEVQRQRTLPFWSHLALRPLVDAPQVTEDTELEPSSLGSTVADTASAGIEQDDLGHADFDDGDDALETDGQHAGKTFDETLNNDISLLKGLVDRLEYQRQFRDHRMLQSLHREGASLFRLAEACERKENQANSTRGAGPSTWDRGLSSAMFFRSRPLLRDMDT